jgi:RimJ/RimL family protein N-acetyltransferase
MVEIGTDRLIMRGWRESDQAPWAAMNADPEVRQYVDEAPLRRHRVCRKLRDR